MLRPCGCFSQVPPFQRRSLKVSKSQSKFLTWWWGLINEAGSEWRMAASAFCILENSLSCRRQELLPEQLELGRRRQSEKSVHQLNRIWTHAVNLLLVCFSSDQLRHVPVLRLPAGTTAAEAQRVELLRLLLGKNHLLMQQYLHNQPHRDQFGDFGGAASHFQFHTHCFTVVKVRWQHVWKTNLISICILCHSHPLNARSDTEELLVCRCTKCGTFKLKPGLQSPTQGKGGCKAALVVWYAYKSLGFCVNHCDYSAAVVESKDVTSVSEGGSSPPLPPPALKPQPSLFIFCHDSIFICVWSLWGWPPALMRSTQAARLLNITAHIRVAGRYESAVCCCSALCCCAQ